MAFNVYSGPGTSAYASSRFAASVNATTSYVYGQTFTPTGPADVWTGSDPVEISWLKFTADQTATVSVSKLSGTITSAKVYPENVATQIIVGGILILGVPTNVRLHLEINNDRANILAVLAQPLPRATPAGAVAWDDVGIKPVSVDHTSDTFTSPAHGLTNGQRVGFESTGTYPAATGGDLAAFVHYYVANATTDTFQLERSAGGGVILLTSNGTGTRTVYITGWSNTSAPLLFPVGVWSINRMFDLASNVTVHFEPDAVVIGGFDVRGTNGVTVQGQGTLLGTFATHAFVFSGSLGWEDQLPYCMLLGYDGVQQKWDNEVQGITIAAMPFFCNFEGVCEWVNASIINPWFYGTTGPKASGKSDLYPVGQIVDCYSYSGDDNILLGEQVAGIFAIVQGCFLVTANNSCLHLAYWSGPDANTICFVSNCDMMHVGVADNGRGSATFPTFGGNSIVKAWTDGYDGEDSYGRFGVAIQQCRVWGPVKSRLLHLGNFPYPYTFYGEESRARKGQAARWLIEGLTVQQTPGQLSIIEGLDWLNTPHSIAFNGVSVGGTKWTAANLETFLSWNAYPYFLTVEGKTVTTAVELCNRAIGMIGESPTLTSIAPPDDTKLAKLCARLFAPCFETITQGHEWSWATKRAALTLVPNAGNDTYRYCYEIPAGMLQLLELMPKGAPDGYLDHAGRKVLGRIEVGTQTVQRIWTNLPDAWARFTVYVTNVNLLDPYAQKALVFELAAKLTAAIMQGKEGQASMLQYEQMAQVYIQKARAVDGNQRVLTPVQKVTWLEGREG